MPSVLKKGFWLFGFSVLLLVLFLPGYSKLQELRDKNFALETRIEELDKENQSLQQELHKIEHDPLYQEKIAREKMGVVRKGEIPVKIIPETK